MASFCHHHLIPFLFLLAFIISPTTSATTHPESLLLKITKDAITSQYTTKILQRTPAVSVPLTLDLGTPNLWVNCDDYVSSTYKPVPCGCPLCDLANATICCSCYTKPKPGPGCNKNTCRTVITNPVTGSSTSPNGSELATDVIQLNSSNGATTTGLVSVPNFLFVCAPASLLGGLAEGVMGVAGFGKSKASFPTLLSFTSHLPQIFAFCLSPGTGFAFVGDGPYNITPEGTGTNLDLRSKLTYTPLITNPVRPSEYFIGVRRIIIGGKVIPINESLLSIDSKGKGGTTISLLYPYTTMETSIYNAVTTEFNKQILKIAYPLGKKIPPRPPFKYCYDILPTVPPGPAVPNIHLVLRSTSKNNEVEWIIAPLNSLVQTDIGWCIGFLDGGKNPKSSIVIGGYQIEDNLLQFDLAQSRIGSTDTLVYNRGGCSLFNFTTM